MRLLHEEPDFADLLAVTGRKLGIDPGLVEKDYWMARRYDRRRDLSVRSRMVADVDVY
jgi:hypothetical protein